MLQLGEASLSTGRGNTELQLLEVDCVVHPPEASSFRDGVPPPVLSLERFTDALAEAVGPDLTAFAVDNFKVRPYS